MVINHQSNPYHSDRGDDLKANLLTTINHIDMVLPSISRNNKDTIGKYLTVFMIFVLIWIILEYINENKLPQDHPCVIETIRRHYLKAPSPFDVPFNLVSDSDEDRSPGQTGVILRLLKNQV